MDEVAESCYQRGYAKGLAEARAEIIEHLVKKGMPPEEIHELMEYPMEEIELVVKSLQANGTPS